MQAIETKTYTSDYESVMVLREQILNINAVHVSDRPMVYTCYGLGSCIGLFVTDRLKGLTAGAHIPLPESFYTSEFHGASRLINDLLGAMSLLGSDLNCLRAKVAGGASIYEGACIGEQNVQAVLQKLIDTKIYIAATDVGGRVSRTARFNSVTGELSISTSDQKKYSI